MRKRCYTTCICNNSLVFSFFFGYSLSNLYPFFHRTVALLLFLYLLHILHIFLGAPRFHFLSYVAYSFLCFLQPEFVFIFLVSAFKPDYYFLIFIPCLYVLIIVLISLYYYFSFYMYLDLSIYFFVLAFVSLYL